MLRWGASAMSGRYGVAKRISDLEPRAIFTHCYGHALNLTASDTIRQSKVIKDALDTTHEIIKLINPFFMVTVSDTNGIFFLFLSTKVIVKQVFE